MIDMSRTRGICTPALYVRARPIQIAIQWNQIRQILFCIWNGNQFIDRSCRSTPLMVSFRQTHRELWPEQPRNCNPQDYVFCTRQPLCLASQLLSTAHKMESIVQASKYNSLLLECCISHFPALAWQILSWRIVIVWLWSAPSIHNYSVSHSPRLISLGQQFEGQ